LLCQKQMKVIRGILLGIVVVLILLIVGVLALHRLYGFHPKEWIKEYGHEAESYAQQILTGDTPELPLVLSEHRVERGKTFVSFCKPSGPLESHGMAYSLDGMKPKHGLGGEPKIVRWSHIKGKWYFWGAD